MHFDFENSRDYHYRNQTDETDKQDTRIKLYVIKPNSIIENSTT